MPDHALSPLQSLPRPLALVFSGGASLGALQVGQLRALVEAGIQPDLIVGTSVGAINGLFVARGLTSARVDALADVWLSLRRENVFGGLGVGSVLRLLSGGGTLAKPGGLEALIRRELPRDNSELAIPTHVIAVDYLSGGSVILSGGDLHRNALASAAIPNVFPPVRLGRQLLVDGGLAANVPLLPAVRLGARSLIVLDAGFPCALTEPPRGIIAGIVHAMTLTLRNQSYGVLPRLAHDHTIIYLPVPCPLATAPHDFSHARELIAAGYKLTGEFLSRYKAGAPGVYGHPHFHGDEP